MMNNRSGILKIRGIRREPVRGQADLTEQLRKDGASPEVHELETAAKLLYHTDGSCYLFYQEEAEEGVTCKSRLMIKGKEVSLRRDMPGRGLPPTVLSFVEGESRYCAYQTAAGGMELETRTSLVRMDASEYAMNLQMEYSLFLNGERLSDHEMTVAFTGQADPEGRTK